MNIFVTGATGFLGYHFAKEAIKQGHQLLCLRRSVSQSFFSSEMESRVKWVVDDASLLEQVSEFMPDVLFHAAWSGVQGAYRDNNNIQSQNLYLSNKLIRLYPYKQIICLGSQAEYGFYHGPIKEASVTSLDDAKKQQRILSEYGTVKLQCLDSLRQYCSEANINWQWIRIFTVFGENMTGGLIRQAIQQCSNKTCSFPTTKGEQRYSYLYAEDYAKAICSVLGMTDKSGIYNLSQPAEVHSNRWILNKIKAMLNSEIEYNFGVKPYDSNQIMYMDGDISKFEENFGKIPHTEFDIALQNTINSFKEKIQ